MMLSALLLATAPVVAQPANAEPVICKVVKDSPLKSRRVTACGTEAQWANHREITRKAERRALAHSGAYAGVGSGY